MGRDPFTGSVEPIKRASGTLDGTPFTIRPGEIYSPRHPVVKRYPEFFRPLEKHRQRPEIEQATNAPGERR